MTRYRWRNNAKDLLFNYTANLAKLKANEQDIIYGITADRDHCYRRGGVSNPTAAKALLLTAESRSRLAADVAVVYKLIASLRTERRVDKKQLQLLDMVYFRGKASLLNAAVRLEISERTAKRWNNKALEFIAREKGWL